MAIGFGVFMILTYVLCTLWKYNWCRKQKELPSHVSSTSVGTQTGASVDYSDYQEIHYVPQRSWLTPSVRYMSMPYAVSNTHKYQDLTVPYSNVQSGQENEYLELLAYPYIHVPDGNTRDKVNDIVTPIVKALCSEDQGNERYVTLEKKLKTIASELKKDHN